MKKQNKNDEEIVIEEEFDSNKVDNKIKRLKEELSACKKEKQEYLDGWQRAQADYVNLKKRVELEKNENKEKILISFIEDLLPAIDSFEMAIKNKESWESVSKDWRVGMEYVFNQLKKILEENNISPIDPLGEEFNHIKHNSVKQVETENKKDDHKIVEVLQKGYQVGDKTIRPAQVCVAILKN